MYAFIRLKRGYRRLFYLFSLCKLCYAVNKEKGGKSKIIFFNVQFVKIFSKSQKWDISPCKI